MKLSTSILALSSLFTLTLAAPTPGDLKHHPSTTRCDVEGFTRCPYLDEGLGYPWCGWKCPLNPIRFVCRNGHWVRDDCTKRWEVCKPVHKFGRRQGICYAPDQWELFDPEIITEDWEKKDYDTTKEWIEEHVGDK